MSWIPNLALHRKLSARVMLSDPGMQQADAADETSKTIDAFRLLLIRDSVTVGTLTWSLPLTVDGEALKAPGEPVSAVLSDADIDTGTWTARIESTNGTYALTTTSVGKIGTDITVADDIDSAIGISVTLTLGLDSDLSSGGAPAPPGDLTLFPFSASSPWNAAVPGSASYLPSSDARTAEIRRTYKPAVSGYADETGGSIAWAVNAQGFAISVAYGTPGGPTKTIRIRDMFGSRFDYYVTIPWPVGTQPASGTDMHLAVLDPDGATVHEMWHCELQGDGTYIAASYSRTRLDGTGWNLYTDALVTGSNPRGRDPAEAVDGVGAARAVSVSILGGLIRQADIDAGVINHALAIAVPRTYIRRGPRVYPADATSSYYDGDGRSTGPLAYSMRFALPTSYNLDGQGFTPYWRMVAQAFKTHGCYIVDVAGVFNPCIYMEYPAALTAGMALRDASGGQSTHFPKIWQNLHYVDWV